MGVLGVIGRAVRVFCAMWVACLCMTVHDHCAMNRFISSVLALKPSMRSSSITKSKNL